ncbi:MAG: glycosyltransferase family 9 protein [Flavipsychrobacter sp.]|nr:glycosyltransferase family 9 protein [Flavipsychrobacter sp.]
MKILVIRFSSIGDIVLTTPVVRCLKQQKPGTEIHYLTKAVYGSILAYNPYIDKLHYLEDDLDKVAEALKKEHFDYVVDLHHNLRTLRIKRALNVKSFSYNKLNIEKWLLVNFKWHTMPDKSIVDRYFETIAPLEVENDGKGLDYFLEDSVEITNKDIPMSHWNGYVGCVIGGSYNTKKLPVAQWHKLFQAMPYPVILLGGPGDVEEGRQVAALDSIRIYNACGKFNLEESARLVQMARVIVSNDTGLMHIAAAYKKPVLSLWGNTSPEMGMFPYYGYNNLKSRPAPQSLIFENKNLSCHPCSKLGYNKCPQKHFNCMNGLNMNELAEAVKNIWKSPQL